MTHDASGAVALSEATDAAVVAPICPACAGRECALLYEVRNVPTNSCLLVPDRAAALDFPKGDIRLYLCGACGFAFNGAWEPGRTVYSEDYEETQGFSPTFSAFDRELAAELVRRYDVRNKRIFEIGCGKGEFLSLLCEIGDNRGVGYDPSFVPARRPDRASGLVTFVQAFVDARTEIVDADLVCCKMTLEHVAAAGRFIRDIRLAVTRSPQAVFFVQVPNFDYIVDRCAFWDVYYEHCSYFTAHSLVRLLERSGFEVLRCRTGYDDQYLMVEARPAAASVVRRDRPGLAPSRAATFGLEAARRQAQWRERFRDYKQRGLRTAIWGSGSKAVSFLTTVGLWDEVDDVVDINPFRQSKYMPGSGHRIVSPQAARANPSDVIVVMNPIYIPEIRDSFTGSGIAPEFISVEA